MTDYQQMLTRYEGGLKIDEHKLEEHWVAHAEDLYKVSKAHAMVLSLRDEAKQQQAETEAEADARIRVALGRTEDRVTEKQVESRRKLDPEVQRAVVHYNSLNLLERQYGALKEAYLQRGYALKALVELYVNNYYGATETPIRQVRDTNASRARVAISRVRRERDDQRAK